MDIIARMPLKSELTVAAVVEVTGRFLVVEERIKGRNVLNQPAGHVEEGETLLEAVAREACEETAWHFTPQALIGMYLWRYPGSARATLRFAFMGSVCDHDARRPLDHGILGTHWLDRSQIIERGPQLRSPLVLRCIDDYLAGKRLPLDAVAWLDSSAPFEAAAAARL